MCRHCDGTPDADRAVSAPRSEDTGATGQAPRGTRLGGARNYAGAFAPTPGRLAGLAFIRLYQLTLSGFIGNSCRHLPTCSEYGFEAIARHGLWKGGWMTLFRVARCGPGGTSGFDPVPPMLSERLRWWSIWRFWRLPG